MLGRYVYSYLSRKFDVIGTDRSWFSVDYFSEAHGWLLGIAPGDVIINCIGLIKQRKDKLPLDFVNINTAFPLVLSSVCKNIGAKFVHVTTDCVFDGEKGQYNEQDKHTANDVYGMSKSLGEPKEANVIRTSIIGEEKENKLSLLEWAKSKRGETVNGFLNHHWNGITCLQFAKLCEQIINDNLFWSGVKHVFSPNAVSKYELLCMISDAFKLDLNVIPFYADENCDRTLTSIRDDVIISVPELEYQLKELRNYSFE